MDQAEKALAIRLWEEAQDAVQRGDWKTVKAKSEQGLQIGNLPLEIEMFLRRYRAMSTINVFVGSELKVNGTYPAYEEGHLKRAVEDFKAVIGFCLANRNSVLFASIAEDYHYYGTTLYALQVFANGYEAKRSLVLQAIEQLKKSLVISPGARNTRGLLEKFDGRIMDLEAENMFESRRARRAKSNSGCFIATAVYGSSFEPEVMAFRQFRDEVLLSSRLGYLLVQLYYFVSPPLANFISKRRLMRTITKRVFLDTILSFIKKERKAKNAKLQKL